MLFVSSKNFRIVSQTSAIPAWVIALQVEVVGIHPDFFGGNRCRALLNSTFARLALLILSPSALLMTIASAISMMPRLIPWSSSPAPEILSKRKKSTIEWTAVSLWPTPTVSIIIVSKPAASQRIMDSLVFLATPPRVFPDAEGRINAFSSFTNSSILVLSPRMLPCEMVLLGSTASTATFLPRLVRYFPNASMNVLLPTPGTPVIPMRTDLFAWGRQALITSLALAK